MKLTLFLLLALPAIASASYNPSSGGGVTLSTSSHIITNGPTPSVTNCGTGSPSVAGDDTAGIITLGGGVPTSCVLLFANTWGSTPVCTITPGNAFASAVTVISSTSTTFTVSATVAKIYYHCRCVGSGCV